MTMYVVAVRSLCTKHALDTRRWWNSRPPGSLPPLPVLTARQPPKEFEMPTFSTAEEAQAWLDDYRKWPCAEIVKARAIAGPVLPNANTGKSLPGKPGKIMDTPMLAPPKLGR